MVRSKVAPALRLGWCRCFSQSFRASPSAEISLLKFTTTDVRCWRYWSFLPIVNAQIIPWGKLAVPNAQPRLLKQIMRPYIVFTEVHKQICQATAHVKEMLCVGITSVSDGEGRPIFCHSCSHEPLIKQQAAKVVLTVNKAKMSTSKNNENRILFLCAWIKKYNCLRFAKNTIKHLQEKNLRA